MDWGEVNGRYRISKGTPNLCFDTMGNRPSRLGLTRSQPYKTANLALADGY